jgi:hypothetical protein
MITVVLREIGIALAFFAIPLWAFGIHWEAFATGAALVGLDACMAYRSRRTIHAADQGCANTADVARKEKACDLARAAW